MPREKWIQLALKSGFIAYVSGGFVAGVFLCKDCEENPIGYILVSIVIGISSWFFFGFPPKTEADISPSINVWPYIAACWLVAFATLLFFDYRKHRRNESRP
jgi:hypothetical protein